MGNEVKESRMNGASGLPGTPDNRLGASERVSKTDRVAAGLYSGRIIRTAVGAQACKVIVPGTTSFTLDCPLPMTSGAFSYGFGVADNRPLAEGTAVLVHKTDAASSSGVILCVLPASTGLVDGKLDRVVAPLVEEEPGAIAATEAAYTANQTGARGTVQAPSGRCDGVFPGDYAEYSEFGVGLFIGRLMTHLRASDSAKIECFLPDDLVRIVSGMFEKYTDMGVERTYNSNGNCTLEFIGSPHQCEAEGAYSYVPTIQLSDADGEHARTRNADPIEDGEQPIGRFAMYTGALPGVFQMFVMSPHRSGAVRKYSDKVGDHGLFHAAVDDCGRLTLRSAAELVIKRTDKIAVPKKLKEASDPSGKRSAIRKAKKPWVWGEPSDPLSKSLQLLDAEAWWRHNTYLNFAANAAEGDWYLEDETDLMPLPDDYDTVSEAAEEHSKDDYAEGADKSCGIVLRKDGGITMRGSEGAEVTMAGGKLIFTAPNGIEMRSGGSVTTLAGNDVITKARNSVDITATDHDVRIKAQENLQMYSDRSVLIDCAATQDTAPDPDEAGEAASGAGIVVRAPQSRVAVDGREVSIAAFNSLVLDTARNVSGTIAMLAGKLTGAFKEVVLAAGARSGIRLSEGSADLAAGSVALTAGGSLKLVERVEQWQPGRRTPVDGSLFTKLTSVFKDNSEAWDTLRDSSGWLSEYNLEARERWYFTYRTDKDYERDIGPRFYESYWAYRLRKKGAETTWPELALNDTYPWPGKARYEGEKFYFQLDSEVNIADSATGVGAKERTAEGAKFNGKSFNDYAG